MMKLKHSKYTYSDVSHCLVGLMICQICRTKIKEGQYRYYLNVKLDAYISEHRECSKSDENWGILDRIENKKLKDKAELNAICEDFYEKYGNAGVDTLISIKGG